MTRLTALLAGALSSLTLVAPVAHAAVDRSDSGFVGDGVIVVWEPGADAADRRAARSDAEVSLDQGLGHPRFQLVSPENGQTVSDAIATLRDDPAVQSASRNGYHVPHAVPNDPLFGELWGLRNTGVGIDGFVGALAGADIDAVAAWDRTVGSPSTVVAVIDSGYRFDHPDLAPVAWTNPGETGAKATNGIDDDANGWVDDSRGYDFVGTNAASPVSDNDPTDDNILAGGHGVHTAGTVGAAGGNSTGITGVAQDARIMPLRVCSYSLAAGNVICPIASEVAAINYAGRNGARVANLSLGGTTATPSVLQALAQNPGTLYVISAGNDTDDNDAVPHYPCNYNPATSGVGGAIDNVICVAATDQADQLASFSDWGATSVDLAAPGTETLSTYPTYTWDPIFSDNFETNDFGSKWTATGANGGFARTNESPLTSFGMSDSPGATPVANTTRASTSVGTTLPSGYTGCKLTQSRTVNLGTGAQYRYSVLLNDTELVGSSPTTSGNNFTLSFAPAGLSAGGTLKLRFSYAAGTAPQAANGVWIDGLSLTCAKASSLNLTYGYLDGTSMAAPHVSGAAALLFSYNPAITVAQARSALLSGVDPVAALSGKTVTGGRLDVKRALDLTPPPPQPPSDPPANGTSNNPPANVVKLPRCKVPKLAKLSLVKATAALKKANCKLGKVTKPKRKKGQKKLPALIVKSSSPKAGAELTAGAKVAVTLGPKPKPKKRKRR